MEKNSPAFQFYPKDFLTDDKVENMTMRERGIYITLLCLCWRNNGLEDKSRMVKRWLRDGSPVKNCFYLGPDGRWHNERLDKEKQKQDLWRIKSQVGGLRSAEVRRVKGGMKGSPWVVQPKGNSSSSLSSLHIPNKNLIQWSNKESDPIFEQLWKSWPLEGRFKKKICEGKFKALMKAGKLDEFKSSMTGYMQHLEDQEIKGFKQRCMHLATWLNNWEGDKERWMNYRRTPPL
jgi:hypothetical protein